MQIIFESLYFGENFKIFENFKKNRIFFLRSCSTSSPSGNQVDGSPLVAKLNRIELAQPGTREHP